MQLREVILYDSLGNKVPTSSLTATLSTTYQGVGDRSAIYPLPVDRCFDGITDFVRPSDGELSMCSSDALDFHPSLTIVYPCSITLSKVEVYNRPDLPAQVRITRFKLDFVNANNVVRLSYPFSVVQDDYSITGRWGWT